MTPGFSVKFVINRLTANYKIQITDTTDYSGVTTAYGFYRIEYPDGIYAENTDVNNPDFEIGQNFSEFNLRLKNFQLMTGQFRIIQKTFTDIDDVETTKVFTFSFTEPTLTLSNTSNLAVPNVTFTDVTDYNSGFYTEVITRSIVSNFPVTSPISATQLTSVTTVLTMVSSGNYYEGVYLPTLTSSVVFTGVDHVIEWSKSASFSFDIRKLLEYTTLLEYLDVAKARYDQAKGTTNESKERENYQLVASIIDHIQFKAVSVNTGIAELMFEIQDLIYKITCTYNDYYQYSTDPLDPIDDQFFTEGVPLNRVLTINGVAQDLTQDRVWNVGTVTSVNISVPSWMTVSGGPIIESGTFNLGLASGYYIPTTADVARWDDDTFITAISVTGTATKTITLTRNDGVLLTATFNDIDTFPVTSVNARTGDVVLVTDDIQEDASPVNLWFTQARARASVDLTTIGNSGASTYNPSTGIFNIPNYTLAGLGGVPLTRNITINGVQFDLSADRSWSVGTITQINTGAGLTGGPITSTGTISHADTSVLSGAYGGSGITSVTVDEFGHVTAISTASYVPTSRSVTINGQTFDLSQDRTWNIQVGHVIQNNGTSMTQRTNLNFVRMIVEDDSAGNATKVTRPPSVTISTTPPTANLLEGDEWINDNTWKKYAWYDGYWAEVGKTGCGNNFVKLSPYNLLQEGATNGQAIVWSSANNRYEPTTVSGSKWTDIGADIYRNSRVLIGSTTFSDTTAKLETIGRVNFETSNGSTYVGFGSGSNDISVGGNVGFGRNALGLNSTGYQNTAIGWVAGYANTTGIDNTFVGRQAAWQKSSGSYNTAVGSAAMVSATAATNSTSLGYATLFAHPNPVNQTAIGFQALLLDNQGSENTAIGSRAAENLRNATTNSQNVVIGYFAAQANLTMQNSVIVGRNARPNNNGQTNQIVIGHDAVGLGSNTTSIGNTGTTLTFLHGELRIDNINNLGVSATNILVSDATGVVKLRTAAELLSDIGGGGGGSPTLGFGLSYVSDATSSFGVPARIIDVSTLDTSGSYAFGVWNNSFNGNAILMEKYDTFYSNGFFTNKSISGNLYGASFGVQMDDDPSNPYGKLTMQVLNGAGLPSFYVISDENGTQFCTNPDQKLGVWSATPIVRPTTSHASGSLVSNGGTTLTSTDTIEGYTLLQIVKILKDIGFLT